MRFLAPQVLWVLLPLGLLPVAWHFLEKHAQKNLARFASPSVLPILIKNVDFKRRRLRFIFGFLALVFAVFALARPQMGTREETIPSEGLDIAILLDVSNSMLVEDIVPSRLKKAKHLVNTLVGKLSGDRVGVVAFAGSAYPAVPLTTDYAFITQVMDTVDESAISHQGSNVARAVETGMELLVRGGVNEEESNVEQQADAATRVMILISDGEATEGEEAGLVAQLKEKGIKVFSIGVGSTKGGPIPLRDQMGYLRGYKKDPSGNMVHSKLETANLEALASKAGGKYYNASSNEGEIDEILGRMSSFDRTTGAGRRVIVYEELYQYPLALAVLFFILMLYMRETRVAKLRTGAGAAAAMIAFLAAATSAQAANSVKEYDETRKGMKAYEEKDYAGAVQNFGKAQASNPDSTVHSMNLGDALLMSGAPEAAIGEFEKVAKSKDPAEAARGLYNLGRAQEAAKNQEKALQAYQRGLDRLREAGEKADPETEMRIKRALERTAEQGGGGGGGDQEQQANNKKDQDPKEGEQKDKSDKQQYQIARRKPQFKPEKLSETDAKRIMQQLQEQEKKSQQRVMRSKTPKPKSDNPEKDW